MEKADYNRMAQEIERLGQALDDQTKACQEARRQLSRSTEDFEEFVSTAAHNIRESLRGVASYSELLGEKYHGVFDAEALEFLTHIQEDAANIRTLLTQAVDYWSTDPGGSQFAALSMDAVVSQSLLSTEKLIVERRAIVTNDSLPAVVGDFATLTKVVVYLITNAIQYCDKPFAVVHISSSRVDNECVFSITDNGPGIDPAFHERIFGVFKRLHGKENPGNGLGLAFCRKAIESHGGRIWVESAPGTGSTFRFSLPVAE